jgi:sulfate adenylyltransferase subunit 1
VIRPQTADLPDYRGYAGRVASGTFKIQDEVTVLPEGFHSVINRIEFDGQNLNEAVKGQSVVIHLKDDIDISRGDMLVKRNNQPVLTQLLEADLCWMDTRPLNMQQTYLLQHHGKMLKCRLQEILYKVDISTLQQEPANDFQLNDIGRVIVKMAALLPADNYTDNQANGAAILVDERSFLTVGVLMFRQIL